MIFFKLGVRNLLRHKRRSFLAGSAIGLGLACLIIIDGFWIGMIDNMIKTVTETYIGHVQIHHPSFRESMDPIYAISRSENLVKKIKENKKIKEVSPRSIGPGMISSSSDSKNALIIGIIPKMEKKYLSFTEEF